MVVSAHIWLLQCGTSYGFIHIRGDFYDFFLCFSSFLCLTIGLMKLWPQFQMKFLSLLIYVPIHIAMFTTPMRITFCCCCGYKILIVCFVDFFLEFMFLSLLGLHLNIESRHAYLIYAFHTKNMQVIQIWSNSPPSYFTTITDSSKESPILMACFQNS